MRVTRNYVALFLVLLVTVPTWAVQNPPKSIVANANGNGTLKIGDEEFKVTSVVVKLFEDGKAEISLIAELTIFVSGTWARKENSNTVINLKITGGATGGGVEASGELVVKGDGKQIDRISVQGESKQTHRSITLNFQAAD